MPVVAGLTSRGNTVSYDFTRLKRLMIIYKVVQVALTGLILYMGLNFYNLFAASGLPAMFSRSILMGMAFFMILFFPVWLLARHDAAVEFSGSADGLDDGTLINLRRKRLFGDIAKLCFLGFFIVFVAMSPNASKVRALSGLLASAYFGFLMTSLFYFTAFNHIAGKKIREAVTGANP